MQDLQEAPSLFDLGGLLDLLLVILSLTAVGVGATLVSHGVSLAQLLASDISDLDLPWGWIWEVVKALGFATAAGRFSLEAIQKLRADRDTELIWRTLDEVAPKGLPKPQIRERVEILSREKNKGAFSKRFERPGWSCVSLERLKQSKIEMRIRSTF